MNKPSLELHSSAERFLFNRRAFLLNKNGLHEYCANRLLNRYYDVGVKRSFDPFDTGLLRTACSHNPQKHSQSAHFSAKNGFLLMFLAGPKIKNLHASKLASDFQPFDPGIMSFS